MYPVPGAVVFAPTRFAPTNKSFALVVVTAPLSLVVPLPCAAAVPSTGVTGSIPAYSAMRMSGNAAAAVNATVTVFPLAAAAAIFAA